MCVGGGRNLSILAAENLFHSCTFWSLIVIMLHIYLIWPEEDSIEAQNQKKASRLLDQSKLFNQTFG